MKIAAWRAVRHQQQQEPRQRRGHDELGPQHAGQEADDRLGQSANAKDAARERVLDQPGDGARQQPGDRPT